MIGIRRVTRSVAERAEAAEAASADTEAGLAAEVAYHRRRAELAADEDSALMARAETAQAELRLAAWHRGQTQPVA